MLYLYPFHVEHGQGTNDMTRRLGRGLGSLLGDVNKDEKASLSTETPQRAPAEIELTQIRANPSQPRLEFDEDGLEELKQSISRHGVLQAVVVRPRAGGYELIAGERRCRAARAAGLKRIPAVIRETTDEEMLELALVENVQRRDLNAMERARGYRQMMDQLSLNQNEVAQKVGLKRSSVTNHLRLLELPQLAQEALTKDLIQMGHAKALLGLEDEKSRLRALERISREGLSVRQVEQMARSSKAALPSARSGAPAMGPAPWQKELEQRMRDHLGSRVSIRNQPGFKGQIVIDYFNRKDLDRLCELLAPRPTVD